MLTIAQPPRREDAEMPRSFARRRPLDSQPEALAAIFAVLLLVSFVPRTLSLSEHLPHPSALLNGGALLAIIFGIMILNQSLLGPVRVDVPDSQNASVVRAVNSIR